ncbi:SusC/RagA family TonB-linked outer membrane protein [Flammeovirga aprica]|uniref:TonB-dependent receptor n=1 Tax=Flammeovirga aprica JL-4 TaxID=694437 RepID=A0A7X9RWV8_9BACT|nr:TonB-dependent receptor [Flammeovirga aprica]NME70216.1 TonB-dependent receptor [Flammeovirga aprica JL-4]
MVKENKLLTNFLLPLILTFFLSGFANAQDIRINGIVYDTKGVSIPGASVAVVNSDELKGSITDMDGKFSLTDMKQGDIVLISFIGYEDFKLTIKAGMKEEVKIYLKEKVSELDEVIVIGYGEVKKEDLTGVVSRVGEKDLEGNTTASFENSLQGRMTGVRVVSNSGQPGASSSINVRGVNSLGGNSQPLYVIDGVPIMSSDNMGFAQNGGSGQSAMADINPADIKSIEVLKDASSTAIYGAMGSNGVILITTKQGELGDIKTSVNAKYSYQELPPYMYIDVLNSQEFLQMRAESGRMSSEDSAKYLNNPDIPTNDWQDKVYRSGDIMDINASVSGGTKKFNFMASANRYQANGIIPKSGYERTTFRANMRSQLSKKVNLSSSVYFANSDAEQVNSGTGFDASKGQGSVVMQALRAQPTMDDDGFNIIENGNTVELRVTPTELVSMNTQQNITNVLVGNLALDYNIINGMTFTSRFGMNNVNRENNFYRATQKNPIDDINGWAKRRFSTGKSWNWDNQLRYGKKFGKINTNTFIMSSLRSSEDVWSQQEAQNFPSDALLFYNMAAGSTQLPNASGFGKRTMASFTARTIMDYSNKYFLTASYRMDGASQFSKGNKWAAFPAVSASWKINNENFLKNVKDINLLKLRASYGTNGNPANMIGQSLAIYSSHYAVYGEDKGRYPALREAFFTNDELGWELTKEINFGLDVDLFKSRISLNADYYIKNTDDLLVSTNVPGYTGFTTGLLNIGSIQNKGLEIALNTTNVEAGDFTWSSSIMFTNAKTYITSLRTDTLSVGYNNPWVTGGHTQRLIKGQELGTFWGYQSDGIYQYEDFKEFRGMTTEEAARKYRQDLKDANYQVGRLDGMYTPWKENEVGQARYPGQRKYKDLDGDGKLTTNDKTIIGNAQPDFVWSMENRFEYRNFALTIFIMGEQGRKMANLTMWQIGFLNGSQNVTKEIYDNRWTPENPNNHTHMALTGNNQITIPFSDALIEDASFIRLKRIDLMYRFNFPKISGNVTLSASDIYTWTNYSGYNPDVSLGGHNALQMGHDYGIYPLPVTYTVGLNLTIK